MNEAKYQAEIALKEVKKALQLVYPFRHSQWALDFIDELNKLSITF